MKLAEALIERADLQKRIDQLEERLQSNALVQEGEEPAEDPVVLLAELTTLSTCLEALITRINLTNASATVDGKSLTALIARRDCLTKRIRVLRRFLSSASQTAMRSRGSEIIVKSTVPVREMQKNVDDLSKALRETDTAIQAANWSTDLL
ncbi:MAG: DIP1984 family protein [Clostridia bacterium]|nr:DIP1984 family protein [Clostridia bacterium]